MSSTRWLHPEWLVPLAALWSLLAAGVVLSWWRARRRAAALLGDVRVVGWRRLGRDALLVAALAALAVALLGPRLGMRTQWVAASGADVVLLLDVSRSMDAVDVAPSRLVRARRIAGQLLERLEPGDRAALAAFASRGVTATPLTPDTAALVEMLPAFDTGLIRDGGSDPVAGLDAALAAFEPDSERPRVVVVLSDGEAPEGAALAAAERARRAEARVVTVALGSDTGATVPDGGMPLRDLSGRVVVSRRDRDALAALASATDGTPFDGDRWGEIDLEAARGAVRRDAGRAPGELVPRRVAATRVAPFAALAFALLWIEWIASARAPARPARAASRRRAKSSGQAPPAPPVARAASRRRAKSTETDSRSRRGAARAALGATALVLLALLALPRGAARSEPEEARRWLEARLRERPGDPELLVALGVIRARQGELDEARHALRAAAASARDPQLAGLAAYDLGVLELERRNFEAARDAFLDALALDPERTEARFNLEWTLRALRAETPPPRRPRPREEPTSSGSERDPEPAEATESASDPQAEAQPQETAQPAPGPESAEERARRFERTLDPDALRRWLEGVDDQQGRALRAAAREQESRSRSRVPLW
ncbi:MAG: VWA domain-containing protein [Myxococcota bacterium]|nr:VWA domain-containing protein [Myxococcota bacterium]